LPSSHQVYFVLEGAEWSCWAQWICKSAHMQVSVHNGLWGPAHIHRKYLLNNYTNKKNYYNKKLSDKWASFPLRGQSASHFAYPLSSKSIQLHQEQYILTRGATNKLTRTKKGLWAVKEQGQPCTSAQSLASDHCNWAWLITCLHMCSLWAESSLSLECNFIAGGGHFGAHMVSPCIANVKRVQHPMQWMLSVSLVLHSSSSSSWSSLLAYQPTFLKCKKGNGNRSPYKVKMIDVQT
jgi:hypothetical protein